MWGRDGTVERREMEMCFSSRTMYYFYNVQKTVCTFFKKGIGRVLTGRDEEKGCRWKEQEHRWSEETLLMVGKLLVLWFGCITGC